MAQNYRHTNYRKPLRLDILLHIFLHFSSHHNATLRIAGCSASVGFKSRVVAPPFNGVLSSACLRSTSCSAHSIRQWKELLQYVHSSGSNFLQEAVTTSKDALTLPVLIPKWQGDPKEEEEEEEEERKRGRAAAGRLGRIRFFNEVVTIEVLPAAVAIIAQSVCSSSIFQPNHRSSFLALVASSRGRRDAAARAKNSITSAPATTTLRAMVDTTSFLIRNLRATEPEGCEVYDRRDSVLASHILLVLAKSIRRVPRSMPKNRENVDAY
ncbi:hypothetical protein BKA70DRAFT_1222230 [Coprinopsis sp. MPI-PUGE-AT-0042]|nr:hypothetical protein BKA70DRAFT_1222230 [Coprinopsis sp. MPI-PUGE-AT-0042]